MLIFSLSGCNGEDAAGNGNGDDVEDVEDNGGVVEDKGDVEILYVEWECATASTYVVKTVLEDLGYNVSVTSVSGPLMYSGLASGDGDFITTAWLPITHGEYVSEYEDGIDEVATNYVGARLGWFVPTYVDMDSIEDINDNLDKLGGQIIGIDPGAGVMGLSETAILEYGLNAELVEGSDALMVAALQDAISREEWIVVVGWEPHWKFAAWDLKALEDPKEALGGEEYIASVARLGLEEDMPEVYAILENFNWTAAQIGEVLEMNMEGGTPEGNARIWVDNNQDVVQNWLP
ncbi:glycine betaine ABC transporter substrate-binding protein [Candidatus Contubernalis alkaliaceticus]|uniref:glycine betaine ABC transporter substrate-binding protein n=1 Tax=Candidatus Contubernalis alkaliaceticus TaxID=338645 RepID=UPI001F4C3D79|nr:glycine betaine ABC transporter substrate-binding protein [Candidatus Contubernalis alkalaceticus]UNC90750.1 glycine betaine ABC transporter substrate-binding protein [Candidatus Contubernalis alkalaceticus]